MLYGKAYFQGGAIILTLILLLSISASTRSYLSDSSSQSVPNVPNINVLHATAYTLGLDFQFTSKSHSLTAIYLQNFKISHLK